VQTYLTEYDILSFINENAVVWAKDFLLSSLRAIVVIYKLFFECFS